MIRSNLPPVLAALALALAAAACAGPRTSPPASPSAPAAPASATTTESTSPSASASSATSAPDPASTAAPADAGHAGHTNTPASAGTSKPAQVVELARAAGAGAPREVRVLLDEPALKLVTIVLRQGTVLPEHDAPVPVMIQALHGAGTVTADGQRLRIDATHAVVLAAKVKHAVEPDAKSDLVLLVQHLGRSAPHAH